MVVTIMKCIYKALWLFFLDEIRLRHRLRATINSETLQEIFQSEVQGSWLCIVIQFLDKNKFQ